MLATSFGIILGWVGTFFLLAGGLGSAAAVLTANAARAKTETWRDEWGAQKERADRFERAFNDCQAEVARIRADHLLEVAALTASNKVLESRIEVLEGVIHDAINASPKRPVRRKAPARTR